jgi:hypothetical protein
MEEVEEVKEVEEVDNSEVASGSWAQPFGTPTPWVTETVRKLLIGMGLQAELTGRKARIEGLEARSDGEWRVARGPHPCLFFWKDVQRKDLAGGSAKDVQAKGLAGFGG